MTEKGKDRAALWGFILVHNQPQIQISLGLQCRAIITSCLPVLGSFFCQEKLNRKFIKPGPPPQPSGAAASPWSMLYVTWATSYVPGNKDFTGCMYKWLLMACAFFLSKSVSVHRVSNIIVSSISESMVLYKQPLL